MKRLAGRSVDERFICKKSVPSEQSPKSVQPKRLVKSQKSVSASLIDWIRCDVCKHWIHAQCGGLNNREYKRLTSDKQFCKCVVCCLKKVPSNYRTELLQVVNGESNIASDVSKVPSNVNKPISGTGSVSNHQMSHVRRYVIYV